MVAGEAEDGEFVWVGVVDGVVEGLEALELRGKAALGSGVDDEDNLAFEAGEGEWFALFCVFFGEMSVSEVFPLGKWVSFIHSFIHCFFLSG